MTDPGQGGAPAAAGWGRAVLGGVLLAAATPNGLVPAAELWLLPALMLWFAVVTGARHPVRCSYLLGAVHLAIFAASLRHVLLGAYVAVVLIGAIYYGAVGAAVRRLPRACWPLGFGIACAGAFWARANLPEVAFPHGQPCHALWQWPQLLAPVTVGGEALANLLLAGLAGAAVELLRSWRLAVPRWRSAAVGLAAMLVAMLGAIVLGTSLHRRTLADIDPNQPPVRVAAIEPGFHPILAYQDAKVRFRELLAERVLVPTRAVLAAAVPPELVLWPESTFPVPVPGDELTSMRLQLDGLPASEARLLVGINLGRQRGPVTPAAVLVELPSGAILGRQEKRCLVPGGEFLPLLHWLPQSFGDWLREVLTQALGSVPDAVPGVERAPLRTARDLPFGVLLCYDNAFAAPAAAQVEAGARLLCVLSNEAWYRGGSELQQLVAMSVVRALETATPLVRCTQDGWTAVVDRTGQLGDQLPIAAAPQPGPRILRAEVVPGAGRLPPLASLRAVSGPICGAGLGLLLLHTLVVWARMRTARTAPRSGGSARLPRAVDGSGS